MTISSTTNRVSFTGNGVTTAFSVPASMPFHAQADLVVIQTVIATGVQTTKTLTTDYTISGTTDTQGHYPTGGTVTMLVAPPSTVTLTIYRDPALTQGVDLVENDPLPVEADVETPLDRLTMIAQRIRELVTRSLRQPEGDTADIAVLPAKVTRASQYLGFDANGDPIALAAPANTTAVSVFMATVLDDTTAPAARLTLGLPAIAAKGDLIAGTAADTLAKKTVGTDGYALSANSGDTDGLRYQAPGIGFSLVNGYLDWTVAANALTCAIKGLDGNDPSATNPVYAWVRAATVTDGKPVLVKITAANSVVVSSGSTLGARNNIPFRVWAVLFDDGGVYRLGLINCVTTVAGPGAGSDVTAIYPLSAWGIASSTAEGGAGAADSAQTIYTGAAVAAKGYAVLGYATWEAGLAAVGTWGTAPSRKQLCLPSVTPMPGQVVQVQRSDAGAVATGATLIPFDDTIPQSGEGDQYLSQAITPSSAANVLVASSQVHISNTATGRLIAALFQDAIANAICASMNADNVATVCVALTLHRRILSAISAATTFKVRAGCNSVGTTTFNGEGSGRFFGGVMNSYLQIEEIMG